MKDIPKGRANRKKPTRPRSRTLLREGWIQNSGRSSDSGARENSLLSPTATASHISRYSAWGPFSKKDSPCRLRSPIPLRVSSGFSPDSLFFCTFNKHYIQTETKVKAQYMGKIGKSR